MATKLLRLQSSRYLPYICNRCARRLGVSHTPKRWVTSQPLQHEQRDESIRKQGIQGAQHQDVSSVLQGRGYIKQIAGTAEELHGLLKRKRVGAYVGIDPTASSMHVGHLIPFMALFWMYIYGHRAVTLIGGGTASVGDPTGRTSSRAQLPPDVRLANAEAIEIQLGRIWENVDSLAKKHVQDRTEDEWLSRATLNNDIWLKKTSIMEVLGTIGAGLRLGPMLGRDTVKTRMENIEGMSFSEFCYPVLQAYDWWHMFHTTDVQVQIGGSDQYGNILSGMDGIKHITKLKAGEKSLSAPIGFTVPLMTASSGEKFGKSAGNAVWLDKQQTSVFDLYGFFNRQPDAGVERLLKIFTFLPLETIRETVAEHLKAPEKRLAQNLLAREFVELVHGPEEAELAQEKHKAMFLTGRSGSDWERDPCIELRRSEVIGQPLTSLFCDTGLAKSNSEVARLIRTKGAYIHIPAGKESSFGPLTFEPLTFTRVDMLNAEVEDKHLKTGSSGNEYILLRSGKRKVRVVQVLPD